jgi:hypothetical protein
MYTVDQVLARDFSRSWHEGVALVQEIAATLGSLPRVPAAADLFLDEYGTLSFGFAAEGAEDPVVSLATLLAGLLEGIEAPAALRSLAVENARTPPAHSSVEGFSQALAFYERPDRRSDLRALAGRLDALHPPVDADAEIQRLRERITAVESEPPAPGNRKPEAKRFQIGVAAIIVVAVVATAAAVRLVRVHAPDPVSTTARAESSVAGALSSGLSRLTGAAADAVRSGAARGGVTLGGATRREAAREGTRGDIALPAETAPRRRASTAAVSAGVSPRTGGKPEPVLQGIARQAGTGSVPSATGTRGRIEPVGPLADRGAFRITPFVDSTRIYSSVELEVSPPRLRYPQLPREPAPGANTGYFDLLIDESGDVEVVKLISPAHRYQDRMLVAAAKAWKFKPAMLHGIPVKYRLRVPIILHDLHDPR